LKYSNLAVIFGRFDLSGEIMPIFEFVCQDCGTPFEELVRSASATDEVVCPYCASNQVAKQISTFASKITGASTSFSSSSAASCSTGSL
jgi:putative FmdB family regulatory protein